MDTAFTYDNINPRRPTLGGRLVRLVPGVRRVAAQTRPYAQWWREQNLRALKAEGPLWVVLGDSMSQGIGASRVEHSWPALATEALRADGHPVRVLNLSFSGARTADVIDLQLPALRATGQTPAVVSVLIGSNDLRKRELREALPARYATLLRELPAGALVGTMPGGPLKAVVPLVEQHPELQPVPITFVQGELADDRFHPDDRAYRRIAGQFSNAVAAALATTDTPGDPR